MSCLRLVEKAVDFIEEQIKGDDIYVSLVCVRVGVSKWYFQRIFKGVTGDSIGDYIRKRRLSLAALELVETDIPIIKLAINFGFESQEAFTRAFKNHFNETPAKFRKKLDPKLIMHKFRLTGDFLKHLKENLVVEPVFEDIREVKLVGFKGSFRGVFDKNPNNHEVIPKLWQSLMTRFDEIPAKITGNTYGIVICKHVDGVEKLEYLAMVEVENLGDLPEGMDSFVLPAGPIFKFVHKGSPSGINKTLKYIFGTWLPQSKHKLREGLELEPYFTQRFSHLR